MSLAALACSDSAGPGGGVTIDDLVGAWSATTVTYTSQMDPGERVDRVAGGGFATLTVDEDGAYVFVLSPALEAPEVGSGIAVVESGFLLVQNITEPGVTLAFAVTLGSGTAGLVSDEPTYDFDDDGEEEPATLQIGLQRASGTTITDLTGSWTATEYRLISQPAAADTFDVIAENGGLAMTFDAVGRFTLSLSEPGEPAIVENGTGTVHLGQLILIFSSQAELPTTFSLMLSEDSVSLDGATVFDFGGDGTVEDARVEIVLDKS
jgi:hypothetical protein